MRGFPSSRVGDEHRAQVVQVREASKSSLYHPLHPTLNPKPQCPEVEKCTIYNDKGGKHDPLKE